MTDGKYNVAVGCQVLAPTCVKGLSTLVTVRPDHGSDLLDISLLVVGVDRATVNTIQLVEIHWLD